jgi:hypothetical protein
VLELQNADLAILMTIPHEANESRYSACAAVKALLERKPFLRRIEGCALNPHVHEQRFSHR